MTVGRAFSTRHAGVTLVGLLLSALCRSSLPLALASVASFGHWLWRERSFFRSTGFGPGNLITSVRLLGLVLLAQLLDARQALAAAALAFTLFGLDGLDGYLARRTQTASDLGGLYDAEVDANFVLLLTWGVFSLSDAGAWVLLGGLLRYAYVLALWLAPGRAAEAPRTRLGRYVFSLSVSAYALSLWPFADSGSLLSGLATGLLCYSFARSFRASFMPRLT